MGGVAAILIFIGMVLLALLPRLKPRRRVLGLGLDLDNRLRRGFGAEESPRLRQ